VFDIVSTQMAIHYMFESEVKLRAFFRNVTERLEPGSFFIGTTIDSDELVYRIREHGDGRNKIENEFYTVVLPQDSFSKDKSPYGLKYYFYLKEAIGKET
jgi:mRNA (guanine-N7-)-methyltransferase